MAMLRLYKCDASECAETTTKEPKVQRPHGWARLAISKPGSDDTVSGAFHDAACAHAWLDEQLGTTRVDKTPTGPLAHEKP